MRRLTAALRRRAQEERGRLESAHAAHRRVSDVVSAREAALAAAAERFALLQMVHDTSECCQCFNHAVSEPETCPLALH